MAQFADSTSRTLIGWEAGGGPPFVRRIKSQYRVYPKGPSKEVDIGIGYMLFDPKGNEVPNRRYWKGIDLHTASLNDNQIIDLFHDVWFNAGNGAFNNALTRLASECNLNQNQFDALASWVWAYGPYEKSKGNRTATGALFDKIRQHKSNLLAGYNDIQNTWTAYCTTGGKPAPELRPRRMKEFNLFFSNIQPDNSNPVFAPTGEMGNGVDSTRNTKDSDTLENANDNANLEEVFQNIENNQANLELDNVDKSWGSRNSLLEESDWIGLKQFLIYLCSTYYPQDLIPFVELIPVFSLDSSQSSSPMLDRLNAPQNQQFIAGQNKFFGINPDQTKATYNQTVNAIQNNFFQSPTGLDLNRYNQTGNKLNDLLKTGGVDLLTIDPFQETSNALNVPNEAGKAIIDKRGYGYKLFSSITLNPSLTDGATSKAGGIGFTSLEIESGSSVQNQLSLITIKLTDIQGNKFFDINSPWSFLLNGSSQQGGDYYFRYGWQVRVPKATVGTSDKFINKDEENAEKFWNHEGWKLFGKETKMFVLETASVSDNTITLTQSIDPDSFRTPGYLLKQQSGTFEIVLDRKLDPFKYIPLTLINPEISVNPEDGSIEATLFFRTQSAIANCLTDLNVASNMYNLFANTDARTGNTTLLDIVTAFLKDNKDYINSLTNKKINPAAVVDPINARDWIQVIGGSTSKNQVDVDPASIPIKVSQNMIGELNRAYQSKDETRKLTEWLNAVLEDNDNGCKILTMGDQDIAGNNITGAMVIAYSKELPQNANAKSIDDYQNLTVSGAKRLQLQDDVFSFRFRGSLIEHLGIEKIEATTAQTNNAKQQLATEINNTNPDKNDWSGQAKAGNNSTNQVTRNDRNISLATKKASLAIIYDQMLKASISCIAHPWLKIGRPVFIKGTGFFDGKYLVTKVNHRLGLDNKFVSTVDCMRNATQNELVKKQREQQNNQNISANNPNIKAAEPVKVKVPFAAPETQIPNRIIPGNVNPIVIDTSIQPPIVEKQDIVPNQNIALGMKILVYGLNERLTKQDLRLPKYKNFIGSGNNITNYDAAFVSWCIFKATFDTKDTMPITKTDDYNNLLNQFKAKGMFKDFFTNYYLPKKGDIVFWTNHIGIVYHQSAKKGVGETVFKISSLETVELVNNDVTTIVRTDKETDYFTNNGAMILGFGVI